MLPLKKRERQEDFYWVMSDQAKLNQREQEETVSLVLKVLVCTFVFVYFYFCISDVYLCSCFLYLCIVLPLGHARSNQIESKGRRGNREPCFQVASFHRNKTLINEFAKSLLKII